MHNGYREFIQRLMLRSDRQLALLLSLGLLSVLACGHWLMQTAMLHSSAAIQTQIKTLEEKIVLQQRALLRQRPRAEFQAALDAIRPPQAVFQPLPQQMLAPLNAAAGRLLRWLPDSPAITAEGPMAELQQRGTFSLQLPYGGLVRLLEELMTQSSVPLTIEQLSLIHPTPSQAASESPTWLGVSLTLASYRGTVTPQQKKQAQALFAVRLVRDPFMGSVPGNARCDDDTGGAERPELRGVLGDARGYTGWLRLASGEWLRAKAGDTLTQGLGHVDEVTPQRVRMRFDRPGCGVRQQTFTLAGP
jgi:hypothetical protein